VKTPFKSAVSAAVVTAFVVSLAGCSLLESVVTGVPEGEQDVFSLAIGDCINVSDATEISTIPVVDCAEPHDQEVFALTDMTGDAFPGDAAVSSELDAFCTGDVFTEFIGLPYADSIFYTSGLQPTAASWEGGDRELLCTVGNPDGQTTGTLKGINQ
jgi:hypothetical protein